MIGDFCFAGITTVLNHVRILGYSVCGGGA
jgi:hypothetical protein